MANVALSLGGRSKGVATNLRAMRGPLNGLPTVGYRRCGLRKRVERAGSERVGVYRNEAVYEAGAFSMLVEAVPDIGFCSLLCANCTLVGQPDLLHLRIYRSIPLAA